MSVVIQPLPPEAIDLIAAGEVIDSLAAAVRELAENALDSGATRIVISLFPDLWRLQVADNGRGMDLENLRLCAKAHYTSKIHSCEDLWKITSLGFRGEALHSLAQFGNLEIWSRAAENCESGWRIAYNRQGKPIEEEISAIAPGTIATISNLFGNVPVRRNALPSKMQQLKAVQEIVQQLALCHPQIAWQVLQDEQPWFNLSPGATAKEILPQLLKSVQINDLQALQLTLETPTEDPSTLEIVVGLPDRCHRRRADWVRVAVNGRIVRAPELEQTIIAAFARTLPRDRYPVCFLHINTAPRQIDWNRHPAKTEIYLHSLDFWREQISQGIEATLRLSPADLQSAQHQRLSNLLKAAEPQGRYRLNPDLQTAVIRDRDISLMELRAVAQVNKTYIIAEHNSGLWLVEQHIAHERVLYEQLLDSWELVPIEPSLILTQLTPKQVAQLQGLGLEIESFGEQMWAVRTVPQALHQREDCLDALIELSWGGDLQAAQVATACRTAIRNGTPLNLPEMQDLLDRWKRTRNPRTCPHGRPIYLSLEEAALARFFRRHWVIGKSHGI
ncbi:DNA mismatch repair endonuclease MutL [Lusitaniella coriacea LEGE 07157]|uniref:DNA mismatch repair protein MutL n=1 Tax=Lusitaniella coriacea LEGE 07157 TaxID=945747 RepID=A0A8J7DNZ7_9CYAN|nr:DNA mismatch repair endonuclease MutL [Lusitaniella coriacea]MBE9115419.1 DNA mismatch repair endonuclease MutL [Lusitaniella coriacea LEGE 07157]